MGEPLSESDVARFIKLCGMMGSAHAGERDAAVVKVTAFLAEHKLTWEDVLVPPPGLPAVQVSVGDRPARQPPPPQRDAYGNLIAPGWQHAALHVLNSALAVLKGDRELDFVESLLQRNRPSLSPAQEKWLRDICLRAGVTWL